MSNLTKKEIVDHLYDIHGDKVTLAKINSIFNESLNFITQTLLNGREVELRGFGSFRHILRRSKPGRNPRKPQDVVMIKDYYAIKFTPSESTRKTLYNGGLDFFE